jgi:hypothetical protein
MSNQGKLPARHRIDVLRATRAETDEQLLHSWLDSLNSPHTRRNFERMSGTRCRDRFVGKASHTPAPQSVPLLGDSAAPQPSLYGGH